MVEFGLKHLTFTREAFRLSVLMCQVRFAPETSLLDRHPVWFPSDRCIRGLVPATHRPGIRS